MLLFAILSIFIGETQANAFVTKEDGVMIVNSLQRLAEEGQFGDTEPVSFDRINCNRAFCVIEMRRLNRSIEFGSIVKENCVLENMRSMFDVLDESEKNKLKSHYPFQRKFFQAVKTCLGEVKSLDQD